MKMSIRVRIALLAAVPLALYVITCLYMLDQQRNNFDQMKLEVYDTAGKANSLVLNADRDMYQAYSAYLRIESGMLDAEGKGTAIEEVASNLKQASDRLSEAILLLENQGIGHYAYGESGRSVNEISERFEASFGSWSKLITAAAADNDNRIINDEIDQGFIASRNGIDEIDHNIEKYAEINMTEMKQSLEEDLTVIFIGMIILSIALIAMVIFTVRQIMKTIKNVIYKTTKVTEGDLTVQAETKYSKDELGTINKSVDQMIATMRGIIAGLARHAGEVGSSSAQLMAASKESEAAANQVAAEIQEVSQGSEAQARSAGETSKAIEEMTIGIQRIAENTASIADHSTLTSRQADESHESITRLVEQMQSINTAIQNLAGTIATLEERSKQIGAIAENISAFSNQTNILSLNASIEAARAGEQGKGFAVVASEIRKLAASSLESADGIHQLVTQTRSEIDSASSYMAETNECFEQGGQRVADVRRSLELIAASIVQMTEQLHENSAITEQMSASSEQISASMEQTASTASHNMSKTENVAAATEEQLALVENIASTSMQLSGLVDELNDSVNRFKVNE